MKRWPKAVHTPKGVSGARLYQAESGDTKLHAAPKTASGLRLYQAVAKKEKKIARGAQNCQRCALLRSQESTFSTKQPIKKSFNHFNAMCKRTSNKDGKKAVPPAAVLSSDISKEAKAAKKREQREALLALMQGGGLSNVKSPGSAGQGKKSVARMLPYSIGFTVHAATGKQGVNLLLKFTIHAWEAGNLVKSFLHLPVDSLWFDKKKGINLGKVATPELAQLIITIVKDLCPDSAANMSGNLDAPKDYTAPVITLVLTDTLCINGEQMDKPTLFFIGNIYVLKDCLKDMFGVRYADIEFGGIVKAAWYVHIMDGSEQTIVTWLKSMGWTVEVNDMRDDEADEEEE